MQIPKQPRTKAAAGYGEDAAVTQTAPMADNVDKKIQQDYSSYINNVNATYLQAQLNQAKAYLVYLETLQEQAKKTVSDPTLEYWQQLLQARGDTQAMTEARNKYAQASIDHQATYQKTFADAATAYSQATREVWEKLQSEVGQHNQEIADSLKDALLKTNVGTAQLPALSLLYQAIRSMGAPTPADNPPKTS
jgi:hypothetical protein